MDPTLVGTAGVAALLVLIFSGFHIGLALSLIGGLGMCLLMGVRGGLDILGSSPFAVAASYDLSPLPLFLLMGSFALNGGIGAMAYEAMSKLLGRMHGGLAIATTFASAFFGMIAGSSLATAGIFTKIALPEMLKRGMDKALSIGTIGSAGTFATMIPPSGLMIIYCILTEQSIGRMFMAGFVPGFMTAFVYTSLIYIRVKRNPSLAPLITERYSWNEKIRALISIWPVMFFCGPRPGRHLRGLVHGHRGGCRGRLRHPSFRSGQKRGSPGPDTLRPGRLHEDHGHDLSGYHRGNNIRAVPERNPVAGQYSSLSR